MNRSVKSKLTQQRMQSLGLSIWVNEDLKYASERAEPCDEALIETMADYYTQLQLENPELLADRIRRAWLKILSEKPDYLLAEEAERLGIL